MTPKEKVNKIRESLPEELSEELLEIFEDISEEYLRFKNFGSAVSDKYAKEKKTRSPFKKHSKGPDGLSHDALIRAVALELEYPYQAVKEVIEHLAYQIRSRAINGETVEIKGLGKFFFSRYPRVAKGSLPESPCVSWRVQFSPDLLFTKERVWTKLDYMTNSDSIESLIEKLLSYKKLQRSDGDTGKYILKDVFNPEDVQKAISLHYKRKEAYKKDPESFDRIHRNQRVSSEEELLEHINSQKEALEDGSWRWGKHRAKKKQDVE